MRLKLKHLFLAAICSMSAGSVWALEQVDGVYQIGTADELIEFAGIVNGGQGASDAVLLNDIDMSGKGWTPIGQDNRDYKGHFDGQGHRILNLTTSAGYNNQALFGQAVGGAVIENVIIDASCNIQGAAFAAGILGHVWGDGVIVRNCGNEANVNGSAQNAAGIVGCSEKIVYIENCYNTGTISGDRECAGICGWMGNSSSTLKNCFSSGTVNNGEGLYRYNAGWGGAVNNYQIEGKQGNGFTTEQMASGELAYKLNGNKSTDVAWYQKIGTDGHPMPFGEDIVYANGALQCDGITPKEGSTISFSNTEGNTIDEHSWSDYGFCSVCDTMQPDFLTAVDGVFEIGTDKQLNWFAVYVNRTDDKAANARLTADIDFSAFSVMIGNEDENYAYQGTFDGQNHCVKVNYEASQKNVALFRYLKAATIKNLVTDGTIKNENNSCVGGIFAGSRGATVIENCVSYVNIVRESGGDATAGGLGGYMHDNGTLRNCAFYGSISTPNAEGNGGLLGYANGGNNVLVENCVVNADEYKFSSNSVSIARNTGNVKNTYVVNAGTATQNEAIIATAGQLASGELAYFLNGKTSTDVNWYQKLGEDADAEPLPFGTAVVYANGVLLCDGLTPKEGSELTFSNTEGSTVDPHTFDEWGFCTVCNEIQPDFLTPTDGYYEIGNAKALNWLAVWTDRKDASVNVKLTGNIDMSEVGNFPGLGSADKNYVGTFDGQRHIISNMKMDWDREGVGLINRAASGAKLMNVTIASSCSFKGSKAVAALIGGLYGGGDVYVENCGNEGAVESTGQNAGGVCGVCFNGTVLHLTNVYNVGTIIGAAAGESGSLSGWMENAVVENCYSIAGYPTAENTYGFQEGNQFARGNGIKLTNCYDFGTGAWGTNDGTWAGPFEIGAGKIGEVNEMEMGRVFAGLYDTEKGKVWRMEYEGWSHPVLYEPATMVLSENVPNRYEAQADAAFTLKRTTVAGTWNTVCLPFALTASQVTAVFGEGAKVAELTGAEDETLKFTTTTEGIKAGKAYLVNPTAAIQSYDFTGITLVTDAPVATEQGGYAFTGIYEPTKLAEGDVFVAAENKLQPSDGTGKLKGFRAYLKETASGARATKFVVDDYVATGIVTLDGRFVEDGSLYTVGGQRVSQPTKGLYIVNGKKMVVK